MHLGKALMAVLSFLVVLSSIARAEQYSLSDGRKIELINQTCSSCPAPAINIIGKDGKLISKIPAREKTMVFSTCMVGDKYFVTATTGGEGKIRVYDITKNKIIKEIQPFGTPKTWGNLLSIGNSEFLIFSNYVNTYNNPLPEYSRAIIYKIENNIVSEKKRIEKIPIKDADKASSQNNKILFYSRRGASVYTRNGDLVKTIQLGKDKEITDIYIDSNNVISLLAIDNESIDDKYFVSIDGDAVRGAKIEAAIELEKKFGHNAKFGTKLFFDKNDNSKINLLEFKYLIDGVIIGSIDLSSITTKEITVDKNGNTIYLTLNKL